MQGKLDQGSNGPQDLYNPTVGLGLGKNRGREITRENVDRLMSLVEKYKLIPVCALSREHKISQEVWDYATEKGLQIFLTPLPEPPMNTKHALRAEYAHKLIDPTEA